MERCASETNPTGLHDWSTKTEDAIFLRLLEVATEPELSSEGKELQQASRRLLELKIKKLGWSDPLKFNLN